MASIFGYKLVKEKEYDAMNNYYQYIINMKTEALRNIIKLAREENQSDFTDVEWNQHLRDNGIKWYE